MWSPTASFILRPGLTVSTLDPNYKFTFRANLAAARLRGLAVRQPHWTVWRTCTATFACNETRLLDVGLVAARITEPRSSILRRDLPENAAEPVLHNQYSAWVGLRRNFNPVVSTTTVTVLQRRLLQCPVHRRHAASTCSISTATWPGLPRRPTCGSRIACCCSAGERVSMNTYRNVQGFIQDNSIKFETVNGIEVGFTPLINGQILLSFRRGALLGQHDPKRSGAHLPRRACLVAAPQFAD